MAYYFDFVLCKQGDRNFLFRAPEWSHLEKGDLVVVETKNGEKNATVVSSITLSINDKDEIDFIMNATGADPVVKRVLRKIVYKDLEYEEDEDEQPGDHKED